MIVFYDNIVIIYFLKLTNIKHDKEGILAGILAGNPAFSFLHFFVFM